MSLTFDFSGKVALITGSSSGIGAATAILLSKSGANVVVTGRNAANVSAVAKQCSDVSPNKSKAVEVVADVSKEDDCKRLIETTVKEFGKLDILVNNAGFAKRGGIEDSDYLEKYKVNFETNLDSVIYLTHHSIKHLEKTKGNIVNISSVAGLRANANSSIYCMTKSALDMFTKCMAVELGAKRIRVNGVNPGAVRTQFLQATGLTDDQANATWDAFGEVYPVGRAGESEDIANAILYLASEQASFVTGINFVVDGGSLAANISRGSIRHPK